MTSFTGTFLGGPRDGEIMAATTDQLVLPVERSVWVFDDRVEWEFVVDVYDWQQDDDGRGWWVRRPRWARNPRAG